MSDAEPQPAAAPDDPGSRRRFIWTSTAIFSALTALFFWRYAFSPTTTVSDHGDPLLLIWIMEWVERALIHSPRELFNAPMFRPFADTLAYSDPLLPQSIVALPLRLIGFGPIAAYNFVYLGGIASAGVIASVLFLDLTKDRVAAWLGAAVATFPAIRLFHLAHMQLQVTTFLPLALLLVQRTVDRPTLGRTLALAVTLIAAPLASLYHGLFLALLLPPFALTLWLSRSQRSWAALEHLAIAAFVAGCALVPFGRVYHRAIEHLGMQRSDRIFSDLKDYLSISSFADVGRAIHWRISHDAAPEWVGGGAALLLPVVTVTVIAMAARDRGRLQLLPLWARECSPYLAFGCLAILLSLGPEIRWGERFVMNSPIAFVSRLPGAREIRNFQRAGFMVALACGGLVAIGLAQLARRGRRGPTTAALLFLGASTGAPAFSSSLPAYRPTPRGALSGVYSWLKEQPDPVVMFEVPLARRGALESLDYLWAAVWHEKALIHGFSGYLPWTDETLRAESTRVYRPDFFRALAVLGATHLVVHTDELALLPQGAATLANLREARGEDLILELPGSEVYRIEPVRREALGAPKGKAEAPLFSSGGWKDPNRDCVEVGGSARPLVLYLPQSATLSGFQFVAESPLGEMDDSLVVERSADLQAWQPAPHAPLLSSTLAAYVDKPGRELQSFAALPPEHGHFLRVSSNRGRRLRFCDLSPISLENHSVNRVPLGATNILASSEEALARLAADGDGHTRWQSGALQSGQEWIEIDLGKSHDVIAVVLDLGEFPYDYGRELAVDCGLTRETLEPGPALGVQDTMFERPYAAQVLPMGAPRSCRLLRVRQLGQSADNYWSVAEVAVLERLRAE